MTGTSSRFHQGSVKPDDHRKKVDINNIIRLDRGIDSNYTVTLTNVLLGT